MQFPDPTPSESEEPGGWGQYLPSPEHRWRGVVLAGAALAGARVTIRMVRKSPLLLPAALPVAGVALLCAWGSAVHFAGGQKYDDQAWHD
jgi:hypothetical protein